MNYRAFTGFIDSIYKSRLSDILDMQIPLSGIDLFDPKHNIAIELKCRKITGKHTVACGNKQFLTYGEKHKDAELLYAMVIYKLGIEIEQLPYDVRVISRMTRGADVFIFPHKAVFDLDVSRCKTDDFRYLRKKDHIFPKRTSKVGGVTLHIPLETRLDKKLVDLGI
jgi:hypothetical protein